LEDFDHIDAKRRLLSKFEHFVKQRPTILDAGKGVTDEVVAATPFVAVDFNSAGTLRQNRYSSVFKKVSDSNPSHSLRTCLLRTKCSSPEDR